MMSIGKTGLKLTIAIAECTYEQATLYGERLEIMAYSPEIDAELKIICFPTFPGHCGCMLFPLDEIHYAQKQDELSQIWKNYLLR
ncbi:hypothetical protein [Acetivibrio ethanolgignens]|nr:hypothetical protein [Acetivibrio ethanolgignens]